MDALTTSLLSLPWYLQILCGFGCVLGLWKGSDIAVEGISHLARKFGISELIIGLTIVSIGSSLPEIFVNISAGLRGTDDIGVGNIVGSCFGQISIIIGICVLIAGRMKATHHDLKRDGSMALFAVILLWILSLDGSLSRLEAFGTISLYLGYIGWLIWKSEHHTVKSDSHLFRDLTAFCIGIFIVWLSAEILLNLGINAGQKAGLSESVIGILSGIGTSIPELSISLMALLHRSNGISLGNLIGSNITDPLFSLGIGASLANGYRVDPFLTQTAIPLWILATVVTLGWFWLFRGMTRIPAIGIITLYLICFWIFLSSPS